MGKAEKLLDKWDGNIPKEARVRDVETFLNHFFNGMWDQEGSSHIVVRCGALMGFPDYQPYGEISVPVKGGKKVKGRYIKSLVRAVHLIQDLEEEL